MIRETISAKDARSFYDRLGRRYNWAEHYEGRARRRALELLGAAPGTRVLEVGVGTGRDHARIASAVLPGGLALGVDISAVMLRLTAERSLAALVEADVRALPIEDAVFDAVYTAYVLDLVALDDLPGVLAELRRTLRPSGRLVAVSLTDGTTMASRVMMTAWTRLHRINARAVGGCRPLQLSGLLGEAGFTMQVREVAVQLGVPSEVIVAMRSV